MMVVTAVSVMMILANGGWLGVEVWTELVSGGLEAAVAVADARRLGQQQARHQQ